MNTAVEYFEMKAREIGMNHSELARKAFFNKGENAALNYWKRLRGVAGTKDQNLRFEDIKALCFALGIDPTRALLEIEMMEKGRDGK